MTEWKCAGCGSPATPGAGRKCDCPTSMLFTTIDGETKWASKMPYAGKFFELPDGKIVCFNAGGRWHGWLLHRHPDGQFVSERKLAEVSPPLSI